MALVDYDLPEQYREALSFSVDYSSSQASLEIAPAVTGKTPVILGAILGASGGAWTVQFKTSAADKTGNLPVAAGGSMNYPIGSGFLIRGTTGLALQADLTRTAGDLDGVIFYAYETDL